VIEDRCAPVLSAHNGVWIWTCYYRGRPRPSVRRLEVYGRGDRMCDTELEAFIVELEAIAPPCVSPSGNRDAHGKFVRGRTCWACGRDVGIVPHHPPELLAAALDRGELWS
jgi:hypothetical protein